jgi:hypothetical protein
VAKSKTCHYAKTTLLVNTNESKMNRSKVTIMHSILGSTAVHRKDVITLEPETTKMKPRNQPQLSQLALQASGETDV